jgi:urease accessory protein UreF
VALALLGSSEALRRDVALRLVTTAKPPAAHTRSLRQTVPGIGQSLSRVLLDAMQDSARFPRVQECAASCRLVTWARASAGTRSGTSGHNLGHAHRTGACSAAAVLGVRAHPAAQQVLARLEHTHRQGKALTLGAPTWARALSSLFKRPTACELDTFLRGEGRGAGERHASLDRQGMPLIHHAHDRGNPGVSARS